MLTWVSSDPSIASVDESGAITANSKGDCVITATAKDGIGKTASIKVHVPPFTVLEEELTLNASSGASFDVYLQGVPTKPLRARGKKCSAFFNSPFGSCFISPTKAGEGTVTVSYQNDKYVIKVITDASFKGGEPIRTDDYVYSLDGSGNATIISYIGDDIASIVIPSQLDGHTVTRIGEQAFKQLSATSITLPDTLVELQNEAFYFCNMTNLVLPESVRILQSSAFLDCHFTSVTIPAGVVQIFGNPFLSCFSLNKIVVASDNPIFSVFDGALVDKRSMKLINYPYATIGDVLSIPEGVRIIGDNALGDSRSLPNQFRIEFPSTVTHIMSSAFDFSNMTELTLPDSLESIYYGAFCYCTNLKTVKMSENLIRLCSNAFAHDDNLESINLPASLVEIDQDVFDEDHMLTISTPKGSAAADYAKKAFIPLVEE